MTQQHAANGNVSPIDQHRHLAVAGAQHGTPGRWEPSRPLVLALAVAASVLFGLSFTQPWWSFKLYAPQYPKGLTLVISLTGMGGDVHEIDLLNHYIGMAHLANAAPIERRLAGWGVAAICIVTIVVLLAAGKRLNKLVAIPAISFPLVFLADSFAWLYHFGHNLDPKAPIKLGAFTPEMFGNGQIGQFGTFAAPAAGFWLAVLGVTCAIGAAFLRSRVCAGCSRAKTCTAVCPRLMVLRDKKG